MEISSRDFKGEVGSDFVHVASQLRTSSCTSVKLNLSIFESFGISSERDVRSGKYKI